MTVQSQSKTTVSRTTSTVTPPYLQFADQDDTFSYRLVGSYEYGRSLDNLGKLASSSSTGEIEIYDKLIAMNPEYSFYSGVAWQHGMGVKVESLDSSTQELFDAVYLRQSLAWMMALARSELGATISMYGESKDPFGAAVAVGGIGFGSKELLSVLVDDLAAHLKSAQRDTGYQGALDLDTSVDEKSLAYLRRTQLINDLLAKVVSSGDPEVVNTSNPYAKEAKKYGAIMVYKIVRATTPVTQRQSSTSKSTSNTDVTTGIRFSNRENLLNCQRALEQILGPPQTSSLFAQ